MKVLLCHAYYRQRGGEDSVYENERTLLKKNDIETFTYTLSNNEIDNSTLTRRFRLARDTAWSNRAYSEISKFIRRTRPNVAHFHNTFPLLSPSVYAACHDNDVPVVQTLHNYRLICPGAMLQRDGKPCEACVGNTLFPALRYRCYRGSFAGTAAVVWMLTRNRWMGTYRRLVNRYIALTNFSAGRLVDGGLPEERISVKPNFLPDPPAVGDGGGGYAIYVGRLSQEKGVDILLSAWRNIKDMPLKIIGDGVLRAPLEEHARQHNLKVEFLGFKPRDFVLEAVRSATIQIVPSMCYEGLPMVIPEAYACGTPVVAARLGSLEEVVEEGETGFKFTPGDAHDLARVVNGLWANQSELGALRRNVRTTFEQKYTAEINYRILMDIYAKALSDFGTK